MNLKYPLLIPIIGHGSTDIFDLPIESLTMHLFSSIIVYNLNYNNRKLLLLGSSIIHISNDLPIKNNLIYSSLLHILWLKKPIISKLYLLLYHTPLHYFRNYFFSDKLTFNLKILASAFTTLFAIYALNKDGDKYMENKYGKLWWTAPVVGHIGLNSIIIKENAEFYKSLKTNNKIFKDYRFV